MASPLTNIIFRTLSKAGFTTKGSDLTWLEEDTNKEILIDNIAQLVANAIGNISPYNAGTTYDVESFAQYVSHSGNIYLFIGTGPSTGVTPGTVPAATIWQLVTAGSLAHAQNTDSALAAGTPFQISAVQIKSIYNSLLIMLTYGGANACVTIGNPSYGTLRPGYLYLLTDRNIIVQAISTSQFSRNAVLVAKNCDYQNVTGVFIGAWRAGMAGVALNKICSYNGVHYKNLTGVNGVTDPLADTTNWIALATTDTSYQTEYDNIIYDLVNDIILVRKDSRGNEIGIDSINNRNDYNPIEIFQWGNDQVERNKITVGYLNCINQRGSIKDVSICGGAQVQGVNEDSGALENITVNASCILSLSRDSSQTLTKSKFLMNGSYSIASSFSYSDLYIDNIHSNYIEEIDITTLTTINFSSYSSGVLLRYKAAGTFLLVSSNATENLSGGLLNVNQLVTGRIYTIQNTLTGNLTVAHTATNKNNGATAIVLSGSVNSFIEYLNVGSGTLIEKSRGIF